MHTNIQKPPLKLIIILFLIVVFFVGVFIFKIINKEKSNTKEAEADKNLFNIYDVFNQAASNSEIAKQMAEGIAILDNTKQEVKGVERGVMMGGNYTYEGKLTDVAGGTTAGLAKADWQNNEYNFYSSFAGLKEPINGDYYEGWLVRKEPFGFVNTGKLEKVGGEYSNFYKTNMNLLGFNLYVVTMEKNDGNSAPAKHILEGVLKK